MPDVAIDCKCLSKRYPKTDNYALKDLNLHVKAGEVYGFLGPNGAGKSTTIRTLLNFIQPSSGQVSIMGLDIVRDSVAVKRLVGYQAGEVALYKRMTGRHFLDYMCALQPLKHRAYLDGLIERFGAELNKPVNSLSKGNRQKLGVIQAFMHEPEVLILDEPTGGLDPLMQEEFYQIVEGARRRGAAIFLSSHDLAEVRKMCDRIGFIRGGELVTEKTINDLLITAAHSFEVVFKGKAPTDELKKLAGVRVVVHNGQSVSIKIQGDLKPLFQILAKADVVSLDKPEVNLEDEFLQLYETTEGAK